MVDPKMLELSVYDGIPHLLTPVVTDPKKAVVALQMDGARDGGPLSQDVAASACATSTASTPRVAEAREQGRGARRARSPPASTRRPATSSTSEELDLEPLPYIVVIVDEMADLMMVAGKDIEGAIQRLAQMARAAGIHHRSWRRSARRSTSSPARSRRTSRPASPSR